jgi:KDO2-lipid IV(A) lauroyltransferase
VARRNLTLALGEARGGPERQRILRGMYRNLGLSLVEFLRLPTWTRDKIAQQLSLDCFDRLERAIAGGRGVVVVTAHFGNWDLLACLAAKLGVPLHVVSRDLKGGRTGRAWFAAREAAGLHLHAAQGSAGELLAALRRGEVVAFVIDQHMPPKWGVPVPFFGRPASTIDAPAILAARTGAAVHPAFLIREGFERHRLWVGTEIPLAPGRGRAAVRENTARFSAAVEEAVRTYPEQWIWVHRRWKLPEGALAQPAVARGAG